MIDEAVRAVRARTRVVPDVAIILGANDVATLTYTVQVDDGNGGIKSQDVAITVHGTEDKPVITSGAQSGLVTEDTDGAALEKKVWDAIELRLA